MRRSLFLLRQCIRWPLLRGMGEKGKRGREGAKVLPVRKHVPLPPVVLPSRPPACCAMPPKARTVAGPDGRSEASEHYAAHCFGSARIERAREELGSPPLCLPPLCVSWMCDASTATAASASSPEKRRSLSFIHAQTNKETRSQTRGEEEGGEKSSSSVHHRDRNRYRYKSNSQGYSQQQQPHVAGRLQGKAKTKSGKLLLINITPKYW
ncbi:hypothetical protein ZWY2020_022049 [Hordeum vulgare]|nr:hypothetical protein ZWY2020_022049 [Hordeum vulgare]